MGNRKWNVNFRNLNVSKLWNILRNNCVGCLRDCFKIVGHLVHSCPTILKQTRLHFGSFLAKVSRVVSASKSDVSKTSLLTGRGYPPSFQKTRNPTVVEDRHFTWWPLYNNGLLEFPSIPWKLTKNKVDPHSLQPQRKTYLREIPVPLVQPPRLQKTNLLPLLDLLPVQVVFLWNMSRRN